MKKLLTFILASFFSILLFAQENQHLYFLEADSTWRKELFIFPIHFASDIEYEGEEDARFPEGWEDKSSPNFWSYAFAWNVDHNNTITKEQLESDLQKYFDGLMRWDKTSVVLSKEKEVENKSFFKGAVKTTDAFFTKEPMTLNVLVEKTHCEQKNKSVLLFRFSPKSFGHNVWNKLAAVKVSEIVANCQKTKARIIHELINTCAEYGQFSGSVLVAEEGEIIYKNAFGKSNIELDVPNRVDTKHRLASVSKQFTAMLIMQLVAESKLKLDEPISSYLPDYPKSTGDKVTIHHLLTHTSGIPSYTSAPNYRELMGKYNSPKDLINLFADLELEFEPGEKFAYSNSGYALLGFLSETVTGKTYEEALEDYIFDPLKMNDSGYDSNRKVIKNRAYGYNRVANSFENSSYIDMSVPYSAGALYSTVEDLYLWDQALYTKKLLPNKYMDLVFKEHAPAWGNHYGYGWEIGKSRVGNSEEVVEAISHGGNINGFNTRITRIPSSKSLVILLNNTGGAPLYDMTTAIIGILNNKTFTSPKRSMAYTILDKMENDGIVAALSLYEELQDADDYHLNENEMNLSGYKLLQSGHLEKAAAIFKLNTEAFPEAFNTYDSYGEVMLAMGDTTKAIQNYKKSIQLNPGNENGINVLKGLGINTEELIVKIPIAQLQLLTGTYKAVDQNRDWKIVIEEKDGFLFGNDGGYRYRLNPAGNNKFINPDDGATVVFDTTNKDDISFVIFGRVTFQKLN